MFSAVGFVGTVATGPVGWIGALVGGAVATIGYTGYYGYRKLVKMSLKKKGYQRVPEREEMELENRKTYDNLGFNNNE